MKNGSCHSSQMTKVLEHGRRFSSVILTRAVYSEQREIQTMFNVQVCAKNLMNRRCLGAEKKIFMLALPYHCNRAKRP